MKFKLRTSINYFLSEYELNELKQKQNGIGEWNINTETGIIEINTLEELFEFCDQNEKRIVLETKDPTIEIYNDFRE